MSHSFTIIVITLEIWLFTLSSPEDYFYATNIIGNNISFLKCTPKQFISFFARRVCMVSQKHSNWFTIFVRIAVGKYKGHAKLLFLQLRNL